MAVATVMSFFASDLAICRAADAVTHIEIQVVESVQEASDFIPPGGRFFGEDEQVHVGVGELLAPAVSAHREESQIAPGFFRDARFPDLDHEMVEEIRPGLDQVFDVVPRPVAVGEFLIVCASDERAGIRSVHPDRHRTSWSSENLLRFQSRWKRVSSSLLVRTSAPLVVTRRVCSH